MATRKLLRAQDILARKGFAPPAFDTMGFQAAVTDFFLKSAVSARITVFSVRFLDYADAPAAGFHACTEYTSRVADSFARDGYFYDYPLPPFLGGRFGTLGYTDEIGFPYVLVDEPYVANALGLLKMLGFIVSRKHRTFGIPAYTVTIA